MMKKKVAKKKKTTKKKLTLNLDLDTYRFLREVSTLSGISRDNVISVILSIEIIKRRQNETARR